LDAIELAALLVTVALLASIVSVELGVTVALIELTFGVIAGKSRGSSAESSRSNAR